MPSGPHFMLEKLTALRTELVELAFTLDCRGRLDAADVAMTTSARIAELCDDLVSAGLPSTPGPAPVAGEKQALALGHA